MTEREVSDRLPEIRTDLAKHYQDIKIKILITKPHRGNVEPYFKYRYRHNRKTVGNHTEYFYFGDHLRHIKSDLNRMKPRALSKTEEEMLATDFSTVKRSLLTKAGMKDGKKAGRKKKQPYEILIDHPDIVRALKQGLSLRKAAEETGVAVNTVVRVKNAMGFKTERDVLKLTEMQQEATREKYYLHRNHGQSDREILLSIGISRTALNHALRGEEIEREIFEKLMDWLRDWRSRR
ncbi:MAG: hypothetical protein J7647_10545 [Cyanobacteria bacterium SBLK]|nr:hypothetical protein [Cyanobacteria bacterium SBLK]